MEDRVIYFNTDRSWAKIIFGILIITSNVLVLKATWFIASFFLGGSFIFFGSKSVSKSPQLVFSEKGLFIGFKMKKQVSWSSIEKMVVKNKKVDNREMRFLVITSRIKTNAPSNILVREFPIDNLAISTWELELLIHTYLQKKERSIMDSLA